MTENVENLLLEHLRAIRAELADVKAVLRDHTNRFGRLETGVARIGRDHGELFSEQVEDRHRVDSLVERIERIERRLEING